MSSSTDKQPTATTGRAAIRLDVLCNNPDNGLFAYQAEGLQVTTWDGEDIEFTCQRVRAPRFVEVSGGFRFMRVKWSILYSREWFGNWCWNAYWLTPEDIMRLLARVKASRAFSCDQGPTALFGNWNDDAEFKTDLWLANLLGRHSIGQVSSA
jgi:hypothetical protein